MELDEPRYVVRDEIIARRPRAAAARFAGLWVSGALDGLTRPTVAVVGTRAPSEGARDRARALGERLGASGVCVVSGLALGIDGAAHAGCVAAGAATVGVLGGGHRQLFPRRNRTLAEAMLRAGGAVVSPFAPDEHAYPWRFLERNGIVAALADAVVIVEAAARSGALNTASWAADCGITVFAFPGDVDRPKAAGCLALIRDGATLVRDADDVLADMGLAAPAPAQATARPAFAPLEAKLLAALDQDEAGVDALQEGVGAGIGEVLAALARLEVAGHVVRRLGNCYAVATGTAATKRR
jgi:DNA processing protein